MLERSLFLIVAVVMAAGTGFSQSRDVTNKDLEKYRQARVAAERELRDNYTQLGFPSPEELARREAADRNERTATAERIREYERRVDNTAVSGTSSVFVFERQPNVQASPFVTYYSPYLYRRNNFYRADRRRNYAQSGYFAGGQFWPTGPRTRPAPLIRTPRRR